MFWWPPCPGPWPHPLGSQGNKLGENEGDPSGSTIFFTIELVMLNRLTTAHCCCTEWDLRKGKHGHGWHLDQLFGGKVDMLLEETPLAKFSGSLTVAVADDVWLITWDWAWGGKSRLEFPSFHIFNSKISPVWSLLLFWRCGA